ELTSAHPETVFSDVILRSLADGGRRRISWLKGSAEILRGVYPEPVEGLRMTLGSFRLDTDE
ncbi:MAG: hypothetical protein ACERK9_03830, partial [Deltaproteobacteria bacterium]